MSNKPEELGEKKWADITKIIKIISDSVKNYLNDIKGGQAPDQDTSLVAMQVLSILCGLSRGYSKERLDELWKNSMLIARKVHKSKNSDSVVSHLQASHWYEGRNKN